MSKHEISIQRRGRMAAALGLAAGLALTLPGCGGGGATSAFVATGGVGAGTNTLSGVVSKGPVGSATVCAYSVNAGVVVNQIGNCVTTGASGQYSISLGTYAGTVLLQANHGSYVDEATGQTVALDTALPTAGLRSLVANSAGVSQVAITALTEIAYEMLAPGGQAATNLSAANINTAISTVEANFNVTDIVGTMPFDVLNVPANAGSMQKNYSLALAVISQYSSTQGLGMAQALATLQACLSSPATACAAGSTTVGAQLNTAMTSFESSNSALTVFTGLTLPVSNFGSVSSTGSGGGGSAGGTPLSLLAGIVAGSGLQNGPGLTALFNGPVGVATDTAGNVYVVDQANQVIRRITPAGIVSTLAGTAGTTGSADGTGTAASFNSPSAIAFDPASGNLFVADSGNYTVRQITLPDGVVSTLAGTAGVNGTADGAYGTLNHPYYLAVDGTGNIWVADVGSFAVLRIVTPTPAGPTPSIITTIAGGGDYPYQTANHHGSEWAYINGQGTSTAFSQTIGGLAFDRSSGNPSSGKMLVSDVGNNAVRVVTPPVFTGGAVSTPAVVATYAGSCPPALPQASPAPYGGPTTPQSCAGVVPASFSQVGVVAVDGTGNLFVGDSNAFVTPRTQVFWEIVPSGSVNLLAGGSGGSSNGTGITASFSDAAGIAADGNGDLYVAEVGNDDIRRVAVATGVVSTMAGVVSQGSADGSGASARFNQPRAIGADAAGNLYVADTGNAAIRAASPIGVVSTLAGAPGILTSSLSCFGDGATTTCGDGSGSAASFTTPTGIAFDSVSGNLYVADNASATIRKLTTAGVVSTYAGLSGIAGTVDGTGSLANFTSPYAIAADALGNVYVSDNADDVVRKIAPGGVVTTLAGSVGAPGSADGTGSAASFSSPEGIVADNAGNVYVADSGNSTIRKIAPGNVVTTLAGTAGTTGAQDGTGAGASFNSPQGLAIDGSGNLYVADTGNNAIRKVTPTGVVTTIAVQAGSAAGLSVTLSGPTDVLLVGTTLYAISGNAVVYVANVP